MSGVNLGLWLCVIPANGATFSYHSPAISVEEMRSVLNMNTGKGYR